MKVVIQSMSRVWGGNEKWFATVASGLIERGHEVVVSCPAGPVRDRLKRRRIRTSGFRPRGVIDPVSGLSFAGWLRFEKPDAVLATSWQPIAWVAAASRAARVPRLVVRLGIVRSAPRSGPKARAFRTSVDALIVNSPEIRDEWLATSPGFSANRIHLILNGVEQQERDRVAAGLKLRSELRVAPDTLLLCGAGNISERKGFDITLRALAASTLSNAQLVVIGDGPNRDELKEFGESLGIGHRVHWLGRRADVPELIAGCDIFVLSSRNEGMANVMLEAMAARVPVIGADVSGVRAAMGKTSSRGPAGWVVRPDDPAALAHQLDSVAAAISDNSRDALERVAEARWRVENWFNPERMIDETEAVLFSGAVAAQTIAG